MEHVRLPLMNIDYISTNVVKELLKSRSPMCMLFYKYAFIIILIIYNNNTFR